MNYVFVILLTSVLVHNVHAQSYNPSDIPDPKFDPSACNRETNTTFICNPNLLITNEVANSFDLIAEDLEYLTSNFTCGSETAGIQLAGLVVQGVTLEDGESTEDGMKRFALAVYNDWDVGDYRCDNGVMIVVGVENRYTYITAGDGVLALKDDITQIIDGSRTYIKTGDYGGGMLNMAQEISDFFLYSPPNPPPSPPSPPPNDPPTYPEYYRPTGSDDSESDYVFLVVVGPLICLLLIVVAYSVRNSSSTVNTSGIVAQTDSSVVNLTSIRLTNLQAEVQKCREEMKKIEDDENYLRAIISAILWQWYTNQTICTNCLKEFSATNPAVTLECGHKYCHDCPRNKCGECQEGYDNHAEQQESEIGNESYDGSYYDSFYDETYYDSYCESDTSNPLEPIPSPAQIPLPSIAKSSIVPRDATAPPIAPISRPRPSRDVWMITLIQNQLETLYIRYPEYIIGDSLTYDFIEHLLRNTMPSECKSLFVNFIAFCQIIMTLDSHRVRMDGLLQDITDEQDHLAWEREHLRQVDATRFETERVQQIHERDPPPYPSVYEEGEASTGSGSLFLGSDLPPYSQVYRPYYVGGVSSEGDGASNHF